MGGLSKSLEEIIFDLIKLFRPHISGIYSSVTLLLKQHSMVYLTCVIVFLNFVKKKF